jgi:hypothetical protein
MVSRAAFCSRRILRFKVSQGFRHWASSICRYEGYESATGSEDITDILDPD